MNKQQLASKIWASANKMRSKIEANEYKDYILGFIFYKFLSDQEEAFLKRESWTDEDIATELVESNTRDVEDIKSRIGYFIPNKYLFSTWIRPGSGLEASVVTDALLSFERHIDASTHVTLAAQTNTQNNTAPILQSEKPETPQEADKSIRLNPTIDKIELLRVINAMYEYGFFYKSDIDKKADKKDVFAAFAAMLGDPRIAKYSTDLNRAKDPYNDPEVNTRIFNTLREISKEYFNK